MLKTAIRCLDLFDKNPKDLHFLKKYDKEKQQIHKVVVVIGFTCLFVSVIL